METDDLIAALAAGSEPVRPRAIDRSLALAGLAGGGACLVAVVLWLGVRPDLLAAAQGLTFWMKTSYTLALAITAGWLLLRLGRPGSPVAAPLAMLAAVTAAVLTVTAIQTAPLTAPEIMQALEGSSWRQCSRNIAILTLLIAPGLFWAAKRLAPMHPAWAGAAAGASSAALAATVYGLHCPETAALFVAVWYSLGVGIGAVGGALLGRFYLRW